MFNVKPAGLTVEKSNTLKEGAHTHTLPESKIRIEMDQVIYICITMYSIYTPVYELEPAEQNLIADAKAVSVCLSVCLSVSEENLHPGTGTSNIMDGR